MSTAYSDRNLPFGVLALQMDFLTRDALIAAMRNRENTKYVDYSL